MLQRAFEVDHRGATIRGMSYCPTDERRCPAVLFLHSFTGQRAESGFLFVRLARALVEEGIAAVTFDFRHSGESDGSFEQMLVTGELDDALRMTQWLKGQLFADRTRLAILGFSLGGLLASCVQARTGAYVAMVMVAPTTTENLSRFAGKKQNQAQVVLGPHTLHPDFFNDLQTLDPVADVVEHPRPTLVIQGTADTAVPAGVSQQFVDAMKQANIPVTSHLVENADHVFGKLSVRQELITSVRQWLGGELGAV